MCFPEEGKIKENNVSNEANALICGEELPRGGVFVLKSLGGNCVETTWGIPTYVSFVYVFLPSLGK
jgi:hypothetical protein